MRKIAVFVEGQTELIVAREMILRRYAWEVNLQCLHYKGNRFEDVPYKHSSPKADFYYQIVNIGGDERVLTVILEWSQSLINAGFERIMGLRDMYSREYRENSKDGIDLKVNEKFKANAKQQITLNGFNETLIRYCFAIMETEAWFIGIDGLFGKIEGALTADLINNHAGFDVSKSDPEHAFFHPAEFLRSLFEKAGTRYAKKEGDIEAIASKTTIEDYEKLYTGAKCASFNPFYDSLFAL